VWRFADAGYAGPPAIAPDGSLRVPLGAPDLFSQTLVALEADGSVRFRAALPGEAVTIGEPTCVDALGRSIVRTRDFLVVVDASGSVLQSREVHPNGAFTCAVDPNGSVFYAALGFFAFDVETGETFWSRDDGFPGLPAGTFYYAGPVVVAGNRRLVLMDHGGSVHWLGD
jgi:outer membrane protein assembly factor BamB